MNPYTAVRKLEHYCGGSFNAKLLIADKIRDGEIRAYAKRAWISNEQTLKSSRIPPSEGMERKILVPRSRLIGAESWTQNVANWKWRSGDFYCVLRSRPIRRQHFQKVRLAKVDVEKILIEAEEVVQKKLSSRGRPTKLDGWNKVWMEVLRLALEDDFTKAGFGDMQRFRKKVLAAIGTSKDWPLVDDTAKPLLNSIYRKFIDKDAI